MCVSLLISKKAKKKVWNLFLVVVDDFSFAHWVGYKCRPTRARAEPNYDGVYVEVDGEQRINHGYT